MTLTQTLFVADSYPDWVDVFSSSGVYLTTWTGSETPSFSFGHGSTRVTIAVDDATGGVFVADAGDGVVDQLDSSGTYKGQITGEHVTPTASEPFSPRDVAVDQATGDEYVADSGQGVVDIFGPPVPLPTVLSRRPVGRRATQRDARGDDRSRRASRDLMRICVRPDQSIWSEGAVLTASARLGYESRAGQRRDDRSRTGHGLPLRDHRGKRGEAPGTER